MASIENKCFKLDHARSSIRLIQDHDFDINYKTRNRNPDSETRFGFRIKKGAPGSSRNYSTCNTCAYDKKIDINSVSNNYNQSIIYALQLKVALSNATNK